jgi:hypothetical protein
MRRPIGAGLVCAVLWGAAAAAQAEAPVEIELNKLQPGPQGCEAWLVIRNLGAQAHDSLRLDTVLFDRDGVIARRLAVEAGPVPAEKTMVNAFVVDGVACEAIGGALLNDVLACGGAGPCLDAVRVSARPPLTFTK